MSIFYTEKNKFIRLISYNIITIKSQFDLIVNNYLPKITAVDNINVNKK